MTRKKPVIKLVYLEWVDAVGTSIWVGDRERCKKWAVDSGWWIHETGFLIEQNDDYVLVAQRWHPGDPESEEAWGAIHKIPKPWIRKFKVLMTLEDK